MSQRKHQIMSTGFLHGPETPRPSYDITEIMRHAADALTAFADAMWWHRDRAAARGLAQGNGALLLRVSARRAERLAAALNDLALGLTRRQWSKFLRRPFHKVVRSVPRAIAAAELDLVSVDIDAVTSRLDREHPAFHQLREIEQTDLLFYSMNAVSFIADAIAFSLKGDNANAWRLHVAEEMASLHARLRE